MRKIKPIHPGEILFHEFMEPMNLNVFDVLARGGSPTVIIDRLIGLIDETDRIDDELAEFLSRAFNVSKGLWLNLQKRYDEQMEIDAILQRETGQNG